MTGLEGLEGYLKQKSGRNGHKVEDFLTQKRRTML